MNILLTFVPTLVFAANIAAAQSVDPRPLPDNPKPQFPLAAIADAVIGYVDLAIDVKRDERAGSSLTILWNRCAPGNRGW